MARATDETADEALRTWAAAAACAADEFELDAQGDGWFSVTVDPEEGQQVRAQLLEDDEGAAWIVLRSPVFPREVLEPRAALELNATQDFATLALAGQDYELNYSFPLEALTRGRLVELLVGMSEETLSLREDAEDDAAP